MRVPATPLALTGMENTGTPPFTVSAKGGVCGVVRPAKRLCAIEKGSHGTVFEDLVDGPSQQWGDGQDLEVGPAFGGLRKGIGGDDFLGTALGQALAGRVREDAVGTGDDDLLCACFLEDAHGAGDGATGVNHVIEKHAILALNFTHHAVGDRLIGLGIGTGLVDEGQRGIAQRAS